jgi:hypothetical protein
VERGASMTSPVARIEVQDVEDAPIVLTKLYLGDILLRTVPCSTAEHGKRQEDARDRINALIEARVTELLETNNREVERRREAEHDLGFMRDACRLWSEAYYAAEAARAAAVLELQQLRNSSEAELRAARAQVEAMARRINHVQAEMLADHIVGSDAEEVAFWRREMLAKLLVLMAVHAAAIGKGDEDRAADLRANHIRPILAAFRAANAKEWHDDRCVHCAGFIRPGDRYVQLGEDVGNAHAACAGAGAVGPVLKAEEFDEAAILREAAALCGDSDLDSEVAA